VDLCQRRSASRGLVDDIAYDAHDIDDGLRADLFTLEVFSEVPLVGNILREIDAKHPNIEPARRVHETVPRAHYAHD
jgi:dGTPase